MNCSACDAKITQKALNTPFVVNGRRLHRVYQCPRCGAILGSCYLGDSYSIVLPYFDAEPNPPQEAWQYFDLECVGSKGIERRHGWRNRNTKKLLQVG